MKLNTVKPLRDKKTHENNKTYTNYQVPYYHWHIKTHLSMDASDTENMT